MICTRISKNSRLNSINSLKFATNHSIIKTCSLVYLIQNILTFSIHRNILKIQVVVDCISWRRSLSIIISNSLSLLPVVEDYRFLPVVEDYRFLKFKANSIVFLNSLHNWSCKFEIGFFSILEKFFKKRNFEPCLFIFASA